MPWAMGPIKGIEGNGASGSSMMAMYFLARSSLTIVDEIERVGCCAEVALVTLAPGLVTVTLGK